ncbi:MATE family efflux transporter [Bacillus cereus]|nr:MATE family efflux transporter [Bacillus cereus]
MTNSNDQNPMYKLSIWTIAVPVFIDFLLTFSLFFTDSFFLSRISDTAAASVGAVIPVFMISVLFFMMLAQGGANIAGQYLGGKQMDKALETYTGTLFINSVVGIVLGAILFFTAFDITALLGLSGEGLNYSGTYLKYISVALILTAIKYALSSVCTSQGQTILNMYAGILMNIINIVLCGIFIYGMNLGIYSVIFATIIAQFVGVIYFWIMVHKKLNVNYDFNKYMASFKSINLNILKIGIPSSIQPISTELGALIIATFAIHLGENELAARVYVMNLLTLAICWASAMAIGNQVLVAHRVGANMLEDAKLVLNKNIKISVIGSILIAIVLYFSSDIILRIFTSNEEVIQMGKLMFLVGFLIEPFRSISTLMDFALKASGDATFPAVWSVIITWIVAVPSAYFLGIYLELGIAGLWLGLAIDEGLRSIINSYRWYSNKWWNKGVLAKKQVTS